MNFLLGVSAVGLYPNVPHVVSALWPDPELSFYLLCRLGWALSFEATLA